MEEREIRAHEGFLRRSGIYIFLSGFTSLWELGFLGISVRLPGNGYSTFWALLKLFFIVTAPLMAFQIIVSKEVAAFSVLKAYGKRRFFVVRTLLICLGFAAVIILGGLLFSGYIRDSLGMESVLPVFLLFITITLYFPIPILYGAVQGLKKFYTLGFMQMSWGFLRMVFGAMIVLAFAGGLSMFMVGVIAATALTVLISFFTARPIFAYPVEKIGHDEMMHAYGLVLPVIVSLFCVTVMKNVDVVFAKGYFEPGVADAYTCAASVGSGFFILSAIFMVMSPMVSEEKTRGGDPIMFLVKSWMFVIVFSSVGILISVVAPSIPMYVFTLGKEITGAERLIRLFGFAVVPVALLHIASNYFLAKHQWRFLPILAGGMALQIVCILLVHSTPTRMLLGVIAANTATLLCMVVYIVVDYKRNALAA